MYGLAVCQSCTCFTFIPPQFIAPVHVFNCDASCPYEVLWFQMRRPCSIPIIFFCHFFGNRLNSFTMRHKNKKPPGLMKSGSHPMHFNNPPSLPEVNLIKANILFVHLFTKNKLTWQRLRTMDFSSEKVQEAERGLFD